MKHYFFFIYFLLFGYNISAQNIDKMSLKQVDSLAWALKKSGKYSEALVYAQKNATRAASKYGKQDTTYAYYLNTLGFMSIFANKYDLGISLLNQELEILGKAWGKESLRYVKKLMILGSNYEYIQQFSEAEKIYLESKIFLEKIPNGTKDIFYPHLLTCLGLVCGYSGRFDLAEKYYLESLKHYELIAGKTSHHYLSCLYNIGGLYTRMGKLEKAEKTYQDVLVEKAKIMPKDTIPYLMNVYSLASLYTKMAKYRLAEKTFLDLIASYKKIKKESTTEYHNVLDALGELYFEIGRYDEGEAILLENKALNIQYRGKENKYHIATTTLLANIYYRQERYDETETLYLECKDLSAKLFGAQHSFRDVHTHNLALLYTKTGRYTDAEKLYLESIEGLEKEGITDNYAQALHNLASCYYVQKKNPEQTEALFKKALAVREKLSGKNHYKYAETIDGLAALYKDKDNYDLAEAYFLQSLDIYSKIFNPQQPEVISELNDVGDFYKTKGDTATALRYIFKSIANNCQKDSISTNINEDWYKTLLGYEYAHYKSLSGSLKLLTALHANNTQKNIISRLALQILQKAQHEFNSEGDKFRQLEETSYWSAKAVKSSLELWETEKAPVLLANAFEAVELNKAVLLSSSIQADQAYHFGGLPDSLASLEQYYRAQLDEKKARLLQTTSDSVKQILYSEISEMNLRIDQFQKNISKKYPKYTELKKQRNTATINEIQAVLDDKTTILEYAITDSLVYLFYITKSTFNTKVLTTDRKELGRKVQDLRKSLSDYAFINKEPENAYILFSASAHWFYKTLVAPALSQKEGKLLIITDGELGHIPFEVFLQKPAPQNSREYTSLAYLLNDFSIQYNYSASLFKESQTNSEARINNGKLLAMAAEYGGDSIPTNRAAHLKRLRKALNPIPATLAEVENLEKAAFLGDFHLGKEANEALFKTKANEYSIIHLAMHGLLDKKNPILSSLAFTENGDSLNDNFLQAYEISNMELNADLVVLSACETGYGKFQQGEGVISLARSFMYAGVPALVVSLWAVNDASTSQLMQNFYTNLGTGMDKSEALRQAKLVYLKNAKGIAAHPAFWSPFVLLGDASPVALKTKGGWFWWMIGGVVLALGVGGVAMQNKKNK